ncbi:hypothetical protein HBI24_024160 [Parastagonospora nodorum]|nr:hypothetical protein HBH52_184700 [Parastagonospora nodorum]KAH3994684.1 hypothetical protein HBI10_184350 [Parastagonospora nodorum]KAH4014122.1 hypothetical protein HBI13_176450 [Parastagonospora nodorum]KAH4184762.1 hypothetical protein HBH42_187300 [Parastagonospora nodorum]KAH4265995.1 hypothetical protein HBI04_178400 [Parastagonospora nodorum]
MEPSSSASKVAIPRLPGREYYIPAKSASRPRAPKSCSVACRQCRKRKIRCTGETPKCRNCLVGHVRCVYSLSRGNRLKDVFPNTSFAVGIVIGSLICMCVGKGFELKKSRANERNESLVGFLKHLGTSYGGQVQLEIDEFLGGLESDSDGDTTSPQTMPEQVGSRERSGTNETVESGSGNSSVPISLPPISTMMSTPLPDPSVTKGISDSILSETSSDILGNTDPTATASLRQPSEDGKSERI